MNFLKPYLAQLKNHLHLVVGLCLLAPIFFSQPLRSSFPLGYAGMFTQMAGQIAEAGFALPMEIPFYGPGGIPFVYPPLAMYIFAIAIEFGVSTWAYLRLVPAGFTLLAFIPFYFLARELTHSKIAALIAMLLAATAPAMYYTHVWSAGVVRGLALGLCFSGLFFYLRAIRQFSWRNFTLSGIFLGLLLMTHLLYVAFAALAGIAILIAEWKPRRVLISLGILTLAFLVAAPWLGLVISRHGVESLLAATSSHRNTDFFAMLVQDAGAAISFLLDNLGHVTENGFLSLLALPGLVLLLGQRKFQLPLAFFLVLLMGEASFYSAIVAALMAGSFGAWAVKEVRAASTKKLRMAYQGLAGLVVLILLLSASTDLAKIARFRPEIDSHSIVMARYVRENTAPDITYLYIGTINEAEWFPYLLERTPVFALWGSEWKGIYAEQLQILIDLRACQNDKDWACMQALLDQNNASPEVVIGPASRWLELQMKETRQWDVIYSDERYRVWEKKK